jgi:hypothetical protein
MGYRFILRRLEYPTKAKIGGKIPVSMWWLNAGVAPVYREYPLALQLNSSQGSAVLTTHADVRRWLPGDAVVDETLTVPESLKPGAYRVRIAILDPRTGQPVIRLAIEGRQDDGWYDMGEILVE